MDRGLAGLVGDGVCTLMQFAIGTSAGECLIGRDGSHCLLPFVDPRPASFFVSRRCRAWDPDDSIRIGNDRVVSELNFTDPRGSLTISMERRWFSNRYRISS